jgi:hypothetical protein
MYLYYRLPVLLASTSTGIGTVVEIKEVITRVGTVLVQALPVPGTFTVSAWRYSTIQTFVGKNNTEYTKYVTGASTL